MHSILIVDDLESIHEMLDAVIQPIGYDTAFASDGEMALKKFSQGRYDIVLTDINMKPMDGLELLRQLKEIDPNVIVMMMSGYANVENATRSLKLGAFDFLTKPFKVDQLMDALKRASKVRLKATQGAAKSDADVSSLLVGESPRGRKLREAIARHAKAQSPLLLIGEIGSQKRVIASLIHQRSEAREAPFEEIDLKTASAAEIQDLLVDRDGRPGSLVQSAKGGTLLASNLDCLPRELHTAFAALLRDAKADLRVVCSTTRDLERMVEKGEFDDALYFRIATNPLQVPPLRERSDDLPAIARAHLAKEGRQDLTLSAQAAALLKGYRWPGNFSEFVETLDAAAANAERGVIGEEALPDKLRDFSSWPSLEQHLEEQAAAYKGKVLAACLGDRARAAEILGCAESELE